MQCNLMYYLLTIYVILIYKYNIQQNGKVVNLQQMHKSKKNRLRKNCTPEHKI